MTDATQIAERIREARAHRETLRIVAGGTWLDAGRPCAPASRLDLSALTGITRYEPGDLVLTARAGTTLREIADATRAHGQWLTLDPHGDEAGTIGATIATASYGPLACAYGTPRDHVLGCRFVTGAGDVVSAGGQVVKNVAGFDLVRLVTGAWGTLGVIADVTVRLRALPEVERTFAIAHAAADATALWRWLRDSEFTPLAAELLSPSLAKQAGAGDTATALVRLGGNESLVRAASDAIGSLGEWREMDPGVWTALRHIVGSAAVTFRVSALPSTVGPLWQRASTLAEQAGGFATTTVTRGVVRCALPALAADDARVAERAVAQLIGDFSCAGERAPAELWPVFTSRRSTRPLETRVRDAFDPDGILNPGIIGS